MTYTTSDTAKHEVKRRKGVAHMIDPDSHGRMTFCGEQTNRSGWGVDESATLVEFVEQVKPRCAACRKNCEVVLAMWRLAEALTDEE